jgi:hypothetical protein
VAAAQGALSQGFGYVVKTDAITPLDYLRCWRTAHGRDFRNISVAVPFDQSQEGSDVLDDVLLRYPVLGVFGAAAWHGTKLDVVCGADK